MQNLPSDPGRNFEMYDKDKDIPKSPASWKNRAFVGLMGALGLYGIYRGRGKIADFFKGKYESTKMYFSEEGRAERKKIKSEKKAKIEADKAAKEASAKAKETKKAVKKAKWAKVKDFFKAPFDSIKKIKRPNLKQVGAAGGAALLTLIVIRLISGLTNNNRR